MPGGLLFTVQGKSQVQIHVTIRQDVIQATEMPARLHGGTKEEPIILAQVRGSLHSDDI